MHCGIIALLLITLLPVTDFSFSLHPQIKGMSAHIWHDMEPHVINMLTEYILTNKN